MKKVLVLGAGMVAGPPIEYLLKHNFKVTLASRTLSKAEKLIGDHPNGIAKEFDITKASEDELEELIKDCDLAVSLLPYIYHVQVAKACIKYKKHMLTTSYVSPEMKALDKAARDAGIIILNEIGVDPGIDHMSAQKIIDDVHDRNGKIISFKSYCGGLPAPEANTNPWGYKLSWSPRGVILAGRNAAKYKENEKIVEIAGEDLFEHHFSYPVDGVDGEYEAYPNRDATPYIDIYNIPETKTMFRGTIRNAGWSRALKKIADTGYLDIEEHEYPEGFTYGQLTNSLMAESGDPKEAFIKKFNLEANDDVVSRFEWMGLFSDTPLPSTKISPLDALCAQWEKHLQYEPNERDMLLLIHEFEYELPEGKEKLISSMIDFGLQDKGEASSMSRTVGLPAAIGVRMILDEKITDTGVHIPVKKSIYDPVLTELEELGIGFKERKEKL
ncbi:MAG: saccharopine dehydrogenase C-terminal domain-containing protein [Candidatus Hodarchaeota archaeon]